MAEPATLSTDQVEQGMLLKRLEQTRDTLDRIEARIGGYRPPRRPAPMPRGFLPTVTALVREIEQTADRLEKVTVDR